MLGIYKNACEPGAEWAIERVSVTLVAFEATKGVRVAVFDGT
jgi:hypothetical protein